MGPSTTGASHLTGGTWIVDQGDEGGSSAIRPDVLRLGFPTDTKVCRGSRRVFPHPQGTEGAFPLRCFASVERDPRMLPPTSRGPLPKRQNIRKEIPWEAFGGTCSLADSLVRCLQMRSNGLGRTYPTRDTRELTRRRRRSMGITPGAPRPGASAQARFGAEG